MLSCLEPLSGKQGGGGAKEEFIAYLAMCFILLCFVFGRFLFPLIFSPPANAGEERWARRVMALELNNANPDIGKVKLHFIRRISERKIAFSPDAFLPLSLPPLFFFSSDSLLNPRVFFPHLNMQIDVCEEPGLSPYKPSGHRPSFHENKRVVQFSGPTDCLSAEPQ